MEYLVPIAMVGFLAQFVMWFTLPDGAPVAVETMSVETVAEPASA